MRFLSPIRIFFFAFLLICIPTISFAQPANDNCGTTTTTSPMLTSSSAGTCASYSNGLKDATSSGVAVTCGASANDVWFRYTGKGTSLGLSLSSLGSNLSNANTYMQVFSGTCGSLTSLGCSDASQTLTTSNLTNGVVYYIRIYTTVSTGTNGANRYNFTVCLYDPPANDECAGAISLISNTSCSNTTGSLLLSTASAGLPAGCESAGTHYDAWYSFVAGSTYELISLSGLGSGITNPELQLFSGTCGSLTSLQCGTTSITATGLTIGNTYYIRVSNVGSAISGNGGFSICVYHPAASTIDYSRSYINVSKGTTGGTVSPGDTLEMRATFVITGTGNSADSLAFYDTLFNTAGLRLVPGSIAWRTNEGKIYGASAFTDAFDSDPGWYYTSGLDTVIRINIGTGSSGTARGRLNYNSRPSVFGGTCIIMATYRVVVYAPYNTTINFKTGALTYRDVNTGILTKATFSPNNLIVYESPGLCPNAVSPTNALGAESNGTFGTPSGGAPLARNRGTSPYTSYTYAPFTAAGGPNDYYYGIANNTSQTYTTVNTWDKPDGTSHRLFSQWDITGDHTSASNPTLGNPACDTTLPVSPSNPCGYMLIINSAYRADTAFTYNITNLCPNTYYELSAWIKNICYKCGCDSTGAGAGSVGYIPTAPGDSSGVRPNIAFDVNGVDYYTTGDLRYLGTTPTGSDANNQWVKRGFTYLTGAAQTSFTLTLRNNAPGGGGNDWALDDIAVVTCLPSMSYSPSLAPNVCEGGTLAIHDTIRTYFNNYNHYIWQKSVNNGSSWSDITAPTSATLGAPVNGAYEFVTSYTIPPANTTMADSGTLYRVLVATAAANLGNTSCQVTDGISIINLTVLDDCTPVLNVELLSFNGKLVDNNASLSWSTSKEDAPLIFIIEKSSDGTNFVPAGELSAYYNNNETNRYTFHDPMATGDKTWYRIVMITPTGKKKYSSVIQLRNTIPDFAITNTINPFSGNLKFDIMTANNSSVIIDLIDISGKTVMTSKQQVYAGINSMNLTNTQSLASGIYTLRIANKDMFITKRVIKRN
ncbi:T9SS type A sorting domain-containing protein [Terrimonas alba]|uniref:T9SS type A sorting domain-containing protein n=1 Tax=Terrimonas alba TaxID=3349636 RepID=UPI0035F48DAE